MNLWRIHIHPDGIGALEHCVSNNLVGLGWPKARFFKGDSGALRDALKRVYPNDKGAFANVSAFVFRMAEGDLCWTRKDGLYYLGRLKGGWRPGNDHEANVMDLGFVRRCDWLEPWVDDAVPGVISNAFFGGHTLRSVVSTWANRFSAALVEGNFPRLGITEVLEAITPTDVEDVVLLYLQEMERYRVIGSSRRKDTPGYEAVLRRRGDPKPAVVQVKQGKAPLYPANYESETYQAYLFSTQEQYHGPAPQNVACLRRSSIEDFIDMNLELLPARVRLWLGPE